MSTQLNPGWNLMTAQILKPKEYRFCGELRDALACIRSRNDHREQRTMRFGVLFRVAISIITKLLCIADHR
jgi:hypothetical protein